MGGNSRLLLKTMYVAGVSSAFSLKHSGCLRGLADRRSVELSFPLSIIGYPRRGLPGPSSLLDKVFPEFVQLLLDPQRGPSVPGFIPQRCS